MTLKASEDIIYIRNNEIRMNKKGSKFMFVYGLDTETCNGEPICYQFSDGKEDRISFVNRKNITTKFLNYLDTLKQGKHDKSVIYVLNLLFDFCQIFYPYWKTLIKQEQEKGQFEFKVDGWNIKGFITEESQFAEIKKKKKVFWMIDIGRFFQGYSLDKAIKELLHEKGKEVRPKNLGLKKYKKSDKKFVKYALWDVKKTQQIGQLITDFHNEWNVTQTWSIAQLAERIFRHHFLKENLKGCPWEMIRPSLSSYHGGRNGFYVKPNFYNMIYSYDIVSQYPSIMRELPNFLNCEYYHVKKYEKGYVGIYKISGIKKVCKYPAFFTHNFKEIKGEFKDIWITSFELEQAMKYKEVVIKEIEGYIMYPTCKEKSALAEFVDSFFKLKFETPKEHGYYRFYWKLLNSLYGKFIQMREEKIDDDTSRWITGQMFHPFIASLITGRARAMIHNLEHKFKSIHTSTDSIKTFKKIPDKYLGKNLGDLSLEVKGKCLLLRNRLYLHYDQNEELKKYALHGFKGKPEVLLKLWKDKARRYKVLRMVKPKEAIIQNKKPFVFEERFDNLNY